MERKKNLFKDTGIDVGSTVGTNVGVLDPDPHVFWSPGSGSISRGTDLDPYPYPSLFSKRS